MNYAVIIISFSGLVEETILVMDEDKSFCGQKAEVLFEEECKQRLLQCTEEEMKVYKDEGHVAFNLYDIYLTWPTMGQ